MSYLPRRFDLDDIFSAFEPTYDRNPLLRTDIKEKDGRYYLTVDVPGYKKEDINISLYQGNLRIEAVKKADNNENDDEGNIIRQERFFGKTSRTFYVGEGVKEEDIKASVEDGVLKINFPTEKQREIERRVNISIE
ncbi:MAG: Hsp20/alpha crystallin family protein [Erysipelotrichaceae bacterium]|nr:Hsp20/alpha crystallin family protein [Erysipelotrichaceae bacterium]